MTEADANKILIPLMRYYRTKFCLQHWELKSNYQRLSQDDDNLTTKAEVFIEPNRWIARLTFDLANIHDELDFANTIRHEMLHVLAWPFQQYHNYAFGWVPSNADDAMNHMKSASVERLMGNLENLLDLGYEITVADDLKAALKEFGEGESPHTID